MCAYSSTRGACQQSLSQTAKTESTIRYFGEEQLSYWKSVFVYARYACMLLCPNYMSFFSQGFRDNSSFVLIHKIALSLHATGFSNCLFPTFLFILAMSRGTEMHHHIVLPQGFLAVTQQHPQDHYSPFYPRPEFFIWSHCLLLNSHLWGD